MMGGPSSAAQPLAQAMMDPGMPGYLYSKLTCQASKSVPTPIVTVLLADMGMTQPLGGTAPLGVHMMLRSGATSVPAGPVSFVAQNLGWRTHELVVLPLAAGASAGQRRPGTDGRVSEAGSFGEASNSCAAGAGDGIAARSVGWTTLTLKPGRYELLCNLTNHYADGMWAEFDVF
jgi:hypothetical protein